MNINTLILSILGGSFGVFMIVYGEMDDSPGGQLLGAAFVILSIVGLIKHWKKKPTKT